MKLKAQVGLEISEMPRCTLPDMLKNGRFVGGGAHWAQQNNVTIGAMLAFSICSLASTLPMLAHPSKCSWTSLVLRLPASAASLYSSNLREAFQCDMPQRTYLCINIDDHVHSLLSWMMLARVISSVASVAWSSKASPPVVAFMRVHRHAF